MSSKPKIALIGAGSAGFGKNFIADVLLRPALAQGTLESTTERRRALDGADYVVSVIEAPGGIEANKIERRVSEKCGSAVPGGQHGHPPLLRRRLAAAVRRAQPVAHRR